MDSVKLCNGDEIVGISNSMLNDLKNSYQIWEELVVKSNKLHCALKVTMQASSAFLDVLQKVADMAMKTLGGSKEIGACLTRVCMRQRGLETKLKTMTSHLVLSLANPLNGKVEEWRRSLIQLEKDRSKQSKRVRTDLKKALGDAQRWEKKASKYGINLNNYSVGIGPGVGHGIVPTVNTTSSDANVIASQAMKSLNEVNMKKDIVENTEKNSMRLLLLEERSRFCFLVSCLMPFFECQSSMLTELSALNELMQSLSKEVEKPNQLTEDTDTILIRVGRNETNAYGTNKSLSVVSMPDHSTQDTNSSNSLNSFQLVMDANHNPSDTDSDRPVQPLDTKSTSSSGHDDAGRSNSTCDSRSLSICGSGGSGGSSHYDTTAGLLGRMHGGSATQFGSCDSSMVSVDGLHHPDGSANSTHLVTASGAGRMSQTTTTNVPHSDNEDVQFKTLCRSNYCRNTSVDCQMGFFNQRKIGFSNPEGESGSAITQSMTAFHSGDHLINGQHSKVVVDDQAPGFDEEEEDGTDAGDYVQVSAESNSHAFPSNTGDNVSMHLNRDLDSDRNMNVMGRHTISSVYERGVNSPTRSSLSALAFNSPVSKTSSKDSGVDSAAPVLYPKQALPLPVYTNLTQLTHAAQRKFSMSHLTSTTAGAECNSSRPKQQPETCASPNFLRAQSIDECNHLSLNGSSNDANSNMNVVHQALLQQQQQQQQATDMMLSNGFDRSILSLTSSNALPIATSLSLGSDPYCKELEDLDHMAPESNSNLMRRHAYQSHESPSASLWESVIRPHSGMGQHCIPNNNGLLLLVNDGFPMYCSTTNLSHHNRRSSISSNSSHRPKIPTRRTSVLSTPMPRNPAIVNDRNNRGFDHSLDTTVSLYGYRSAQLSVPNIPNQLAQSPDGGARSRLLAQFNDWAAIKAGSSRASSVTAGSSATNESLPSLHEGNAVVNARSNSQSHFSVPQHCRLISNDPVEHKLSLPCNLLFKQPSNTTRSDNRAPVFQAGVSPNPTGGGGGCGPRVMGKMPSQSSKGVVHNYENVDGILCKLPGSLPGPSLPLPPPPMPSNLSSVDMSKRSSRSSNMSSEAANLMSELSSQLQQLTARTNDLQMSPHKASPFAPPPNIYDDNDDFELPPPPPPAEFMGINNNNNGISNQSPTTTDHPTPQSPLSQVLLQSIRQRASQISSNNNI